MVRVGNAAVVAVVTGKYAVFVYRRPLNEIVTTEAVIDGAAIKCELVAAIYKSVTDVVVWNLSMSKPFTATIT